MDFPLDLSFTSIFRIHKTLAIQHVGIVKSVNFFIHFCYYNLLHSLIFLNVFGSSVKNGSKIFTEASFIEFPGRLLELSNVNYPTDELVLESNSNLSILLEFPY